jgi:hypothetical protein
MFMSIPWLTVCEAGWLSHIKTGSAVPKFRLNRMGPFAQLTWQGLERAWRRRCRPAAEIAFDRMRS